MGEMPLNFPVPSTSPRKNGLGSENASPAQRTAAFRACYQRYLECLEFCDSQSTSPVVEAATNFVLDFDITARRALAPNQERYRLFKSRFLRNVSSEGCRTQFKLDSWKFASEIRTIEEHAGCAFTQAGLYPLAPYFGASELRLDKLAA